MTAVLPKNHLFPPLPRIYIPLTIEDYAFTLIRCDAHQLGGKAMKSRISVVGTAALIAFAAAPAMAADMRLPAPPAPPPLAYIWTGFYLGAHMGSAWSNSEWTTAGVSGTDASINAAAFIGGAQIGWNYQFANIAALPVSVLAM